MPEESPRKVHIDNAIARYLGSMYYRGPSGRIYVRAAHFCGRWK